MDISIIVLNRNLNVRGYVPPETPFISLFAEEGKASTDVLNFRREEVIRNAEDTLRDQKERHIHLQTPDGHLYVMRIVPYLRHERFVDGVVVTVCDIITARRFEQEMSRSISDVNAILENTFDAIVTSDDFGAIRLFNPSAERVFGYAREEVLGANIDRLLQDPFFTKGEEDISESLFTGKARVIHGVFEIVGRRKDGSSFPLELVISEMWQVGEKGEEEHLFICVFRDISERKQMEKTIIHQAHHDSLTGLPNRILFMDLLNLELAQARRNKKKVAVLFLDLDRFKNINDSLGHVVGDKLLQEVALRVRHSIRASDTVSRIGGDEFNILLSDFLHAEDIITIVKKILDSFRDPYSVDGHELYISTSIGISIYPDDAGDMEALFKNADIAMYHAKERGGKNYQFYDPSMNIQIVDRIWLESGLRNAVERGELLVYYQPQFTAETGRLVCAEALVRWRHPDLGLLKPERFIPIAEEIGFITLIDEWVLAAAAAQVKAWQRAGHTGLCVAVNLSARHFQRSDLVDQISQVLRDTGLAPRFLDLEITESTAMGNLEQTIPNMGRLAEIGVGISIDDFGTGYSSLNYLKRLPIHKLKIDKSFVEDITTDPNDRAIISAITTLAQGMKLTVIAEGVEKEDQLSYLKSIGCHEIQGNLISKPLSAKEFEEMVLAKE